MLDRINPTELAVIVAAIAILIALVVARSVARRRRVHLPPPVIETNVPPTLTRTASPSEAAPLATGSELTRVKGLGPRAAARLETLGILHLADLGALDAQRAAAIDAEMGPFTGRLQREAWVEQARLLANGETATFEERFGKL